MMATKDLRSLIGDDSDPSPKAAAVEAPDDLGAVTHVLASISHVDPAGALKADPGALMLALPSGMTAADVKAKLAGSATAEQCARAGHAMQKVLLDIIDPPGLPDWDGLEEVDRSGMAFVAGEVMADPTLTAAEMHDRWCASLLADGWAYGPELNVPDRTSPMLQPYETLHQSLKVAIGLFRAGALLAAGRV